MFKQREARVLIGLEMPAVVILSAPTLHDGGGGTKSTPAGLLGFFDDGGSLCLV